MTRQTGGQHLLQALLWHWTKLQPIYNPQSGAKRRISTDVENAWVEMMLQYRVLRGRVKFCSKVKITMRAWMFALIVCDCTCATAAAIMRQISKQTATSKLCSTGVFATCTAATSYLRLARPSALAFTPAQPTDILFHDRTNVSLRWACNYDTKWMLFTSSTQNIDAPTSARKFQHGVCATFAKIYSMATL